MTTNRKARTTGNRAFTAAITCTMAAALILCWGQTAHATGTTATEAELIKVVPKKINIASCQDSKISLEINGSGHNGYDYGVKVGNNCLNDNPDETEGKPECVPGAITCCEVLQVGTVNQSNFIVTKDRNGEDLDISRFIDCDSETTGKLTFTVVFRTILGTSTYSAVNVDFVLTRPFPPVLDGEPVAGETSVEVYWTADHANKEFKACAIDSNEPIDLEIPLSDQPFDKSAIICSSLTTGNSAHIFDLQVNRPYQITVIGFDETGNESLPATPATITTQPVTDFFEYYKDLGGAEMGGYCSTAPFSGQGSGRSMPGAGGWLLMVILGAGAFSLYRRGGGGPRGGGRGDSDNRRSSGGSSRVITTLLIGVISLVAVSFGAEGTAQAQSPRWGVIDMRMGSFTPQIDEEFKGAAPGPYEHYFGNEGMFLFSLDTGFHIFQKLGTITAGLGVGYSSKEADGYIEGTNSRSPETTTLRIIPLNVYLAYSLDFPAAWWNFPLVPYAKIGLDYHIWTVLDGAGDVTGVDKAKAAGGIPGYHYAFGLRLLLDTFAPSMARNFDNEFGINNTYITAEYLNTVIDGFGAHKGLDLSSSSFLFGMAFDF